MWINISYKQTCKKAFSNRHTLIKYLINSRMIHLNTQSEYNLYRPALRVPAQRNAVSFSFLLARMSLGTKLQPTRSFCQFVHSPLLTMLYFTNISKPKKNIKTLMAILVIDLIGLGAKSVKVIASWSFRKTSPN